MEERVEKQVGIGMHKVQSICIPKIVGIVFLNKRGSISGRYLGVRPIIILKKIVSLCMLRLSCRESQPRSVRSFSMLQSFVAPVIIIAASWCIRSNCFLDLFVQLPHTDRGVCVSRFLLVRYRSF